MVPPVPIPNTVVKHLEAESTCMETCWEDRKLPVKKKALKYFSAFFLTGNFLSSQHVSMQVLSASKCLTTVFGMGTGGTI